MREEDIYCVRMDVRAREESLPPGLFDEHIAYLRGIAAETEFYGGGLGDKPGGLILFQAVDERQARKMCDGEPVVSGRGTILISLEWQIKISRKRSPFIQRKYREKGS